jgi:drug/metabolite transporter (DMT)-like permease
MVPLVRMIYALGFGPAEVMVTQYVFATAALALIVAVFSRRRVPAATVLKLMGVGVLAAGASFGYYRALELLPSVSAVTLMFQFVWMGVVVQAVRERAMPPVTTVVSVLVIMGGTLLATGLFDAMTSTNANTTVFSQLDPLGIMFGLLAAVFYASLIFASGRVATGLPAINRSLFTTLGSMVTAIALCPTYLSTPGLPAIVPLGVVLGVIGILLPMFLITTSSPHLPHGVATIMASSELPSGIVCAVLVMGDTVTLAIVVGVVVILAGIVLSQAIDLASLRKRTAE